MMNTLKMIGAAAAIATLPMAASAVTLSASNNIADGDLAVDIYAGPYFFGADFAEPDVADTYTFEFVNNTAANVTVATVIGSVQQFTALFLGGVTVSWANGTNAVIAEGVTDIFHIESTLAAGTSDTLTVSFGETSGSGTANIDLSVAAVPVPAAGLLLLGALGGVGALRRRKKA